MKKLLELFFTFFKIGLFTFGGGYAMIANLKEIIVDKKKWLTNEELLEIITIAESTPGPIAINCATFVGYKKGKVLGSIFSTLGVVIPSFIIIYIISIFLNDFMKYKIVKYAFNGINVAVCFLILKAGLKILKSLPKKFLEVLLFTIVTLLIILFEVLTISFSSIIYILIGGLIGIIYYGICFKGDL